MRDLNAIDAGKEIDWGKTSEDYARFRPGPPPSFYEKLRALDVGLKGQTLLDLGTGTGLLAREFAKMGVLVAGTDLSPEQIKMAQTLAEKESLNIDFRVASAEEQPFSEGKFDVITANQCWLYFDEKKVIPEVKRLLQSDGVLVTSHFSWLPRQDKVAKASEELILKYNPQWSAANYSGDTPPIPDWAQGHFNLQGMFYYDEPIPFTRESWRGRIRACRGVGAALTQGEVQAFDEEHRALLNELTEENFTVLHRLDAHILGKG